MVATYEALVDAAAEVEAAGLQCDQKEQKEGGGQRKAPASKRAHSLRRRGIAAATAPRRGIWRRESSAEGRDIEGR